MADTKIEWATKVWNPVTGCQKVSSGCKNCYAATMFKRLAGMKNQPVYFGRDFHDVRCHPERLMQPFRQKKPQRIFVNSMSDLFHGSVNSLFVDKVFAVMALNPQHTFMVLTKRPDRMQKYLHERTQNWRYLDDAARSIGYSLDYEGTRLFAWPLRNVWLGVTAENQEMADERIPLLLQCPAEKRFVSIEPMIGHVDLRYLHYHHAAVEINAIEGTHGILRPHRGINERLDWVICGGESGHNARPMHPQWARDVRDQCEAAGVPFMLKQWGEWLPAKRDEYGNVEFCDQNTVPHDGFLTLKSKDIGGGFDAFKFGKKAAGRLLDGREHMEAPPCRAITT